MGVTDGKYPMCKGPGAGAGLGIFVNNTEPGVPKHVGSGSIWPCPWPFSLGKGHVLGPAAHGRYWNRFPCRTEGPVCLGAAPEKRAVFPALVECPLCQAQHSAHMHGLTRLHRRENRGPERVSHLPEIIQLGLA